MIFSWFGRGEGYWGPAIGSILTTFFIISMCFLPMSDPSLGATELFCWSFGVGTSLFLAFVFGLSFVGEGADGKIPSIWMLFSVFTSIVFGMVIGVLPGFNFLAIPTGAIWILWFFALEIIFWSEESKPEKNDNKLLYTLGKKIEAGIDVVWIFIGVMFIKLIWGFLSWGFIGEIIMCIARGGFILALAYAIFLVIFLAIRGYLELNALKYKEEPKPKKKAKKK